MKEECIVLKIKGKTAYISLLKKDQCGACKACALGRGSKSVVPAIMDVPCKVGDTVIVDSPQKDTSRLALFIYLIPLVFLIVGFFLGGIIGSKIKGLNVDLSRVIFALLFMALSFALSFLIDFLCRRKREFMHIILKIKENPEE